MPTSCLTPADPGLCHTRTNAKGIHYIRIAKTASTSLASAMQQARHASHNCTERLILHYAHKVTATHVERGVHTTPPPTTFVVLREPCARLASVYHFMREKPPNTSWSWSLRATATPLEWATLLLRNDSLRTAAIRNTTSARWHLPRSAMRAKPDEVPNYVHYLTAWQSAYVTPNTEIACLSSSLREQVQSIFRRHGATSCILPAITTVLPEPKRKNGTTTASERNRTEMDRTAALCAAANALYPADVMLWQQSCLENVSSY